MVRDRTSPLPPISSRPTPSYPIASHRIPKHHHLLAPHLILSSSHRIASHPISSRPTPSHLISGELDEARIVDGIAGERAIYRRRAETPPPLGAPPMRPKLLRFVIDCSGSMYYFNGTDGRLERTLQTAVMIFEAFAGFEHKYRYSMVAHSGDTECAPLVEYDLAPSNEKERLKVVQRMAAHTQFCMSGDHTLEATRAAIEEVSSLDLT
jgi:hypothetical protein